MSRDGRRSRPIPGQAAHARAGAAPGLRVACSGCGKPAARGVQVSGPITEVHGPGGDGRTGTAERHPRPSAAQETVMKRTLLGLAAAAIAGLAVTVPVSLMAGPASAGG